MAGGHAQVAIILQEHDLDLDSDAAKALLADGSPHPIPVDYYLQPNHPNPFNPSTTISFGMPKAGRVVLAIYDIRGRRVATLANEDYTAGMHQVVWNGVDGQGRPTAAERSGDAQLAFWKRGVTL